MNQDEQHLQILAIFHYVLGGITGLFALFPVFHLAFGLVMILAPAIFDGEGDQVPAFFGWIFVLFAATFIAIGWTLAGLMIAAGRCMAKRKRHGFCMVVAGIQCILMPFGTVLGVFTIIVLMRESVKELFAVNSVRPAGVPGAGEGISHA